MNKKIVSLVLMWVIGLSLLGQTPTKKAIYIIKDGIPTDIILKASTPNLDRIMNEGVFINSYVGGEIGGYSQTPTISSNGYASLATGTWANKNNVWNNSLNAPNYNYPSIFRLYKNAYPDGKIGIYSTWLDNRTKLLGEGLMETGEIKFDYHFDGLEIDTERFPYDNKSFYIKRIDAEVALAAAKSIYKDGPDLSWVYLGRDTYQKIGEVNVKHGKASIPVKLPKNCNFVKVVLNTPSNTLNYWVKY